ncbi:hypothetical protein NDN08_001680 [Rhodosorus marinus]|uniref:Armadillo repeat-containing protein 1 n=1 Tax=Rhodosorus marinus TaxID=101924 RepID=A0AAV8UXA7_9RHOD|nr:hypothetical protein NDN08_001680 [Rhodosorus marinus]
MSVDAASLKTVAVQLRSLAADKDNQPIIARDEGCMSALSTFIASEDVSVCQIAVGAVILLASHADNREILRNDFTIWDNLHDLVADTDKDDSVRRDALGIMRRVLGDHERDEMEELADLELRAGLREDLGKGVSDKDYAVLKEPVNVRIHVPGLSDAGFLNEFEHRLIRTKGIVSASYEMGAEVVIIFAKVSADDIAEIVRQISGKEVEVLLEEKENEDEENSADPNIVEQQEGYVDEERARYRKNLEKAKRTAVSHQGYSSLAERLEQERRQAERERARSERMLGRIGRGFTGSGWGFW